MRLPPTKGMHRHAAAECPRAFDLLAGPKDGVSEPRDSRLAPKLLMRAGGDALEKEFPVF
jgi:hypothetical protein